MHMLKVYYIDLDLDIYRYIYIYRGIYIYIIDMHIWKKEHIGICI